MRNSYRGQRQSSISPFCCVAHASPEHPLPELIHAKVYPIEVKAGTKGSMQSMRIFLQAKQLDKGIRTSLENFGAVEDFLIYPLYAIGNICRGRKSTKSPLVF